MILAAAIVLSLAVLTGYVVVLVGMRQEDRSGSLPARAPGWASGFARRVVGCHVRNV
ncbi:hypothetical protein [Sinosporangium album]|uniref:hypothetical protein n=1 Tax=Sinosporangium album TaxID=504805 RepID=UPI0015A09015|nr:hypothetical protein [Sinosporangium album]